jgi:hypothetical protein
VVVPGSSPTIHHSGAAQYSTRGRSTRAPQYRLACIGKYALAADFIGVAFAESAKGSPCTASYVVANQRPSEMLGLALRSCRSNLLLIQVRYYELVLQNFGPLGQLKTAFQWKAALRVIPGFGILSW